MKNTKEVIRRQREVIVDTIQFLDSHGHSDTELRENVDRILNSRKFDMLTEESDKEIKQAERGWSYNES